MSAPNCPYCGSTSIFRRTSEMIYRRDFGPVYTCLRYPECDAYVGVHKGTTTPLGRLANRELRTAKKKAHAHFDPLWQAKMRLGHSKKEARNAAYAWLAERMVMDVSRTHIGEFDVDQCEWVVRICRPLLEKLGLTEWVKKEGRGSSLSK